MYLNKTPLFKDLNPYSGEIDKNNRWIKLSELVPWEEIEGVYMKYFHPSKHSIVKKCRLILGLMLGQMIEEKSDREIVGYFHENPYFQYFCGCDSFVFKLKKSIIHHSLLSKRRSRLGDTFMAKFEQEVIQILSSKGIIKGEKLILDATVFPSKITYPNDVKLLHTVREWACTTLLKIKTVVDPTQKIRTYRKKAKKIYLTFQKTKRKTTTFIRKTRNQLLRFTKRNLEQMQHLLTQAETHLLSSATTLKTQGLNSIKSKLVTAKAIYEQQLEMAKTRGRRVANRIVSFDQPSVRPIIRGKEGKPVEFGPKAHVAVVDGYAILDHCQFENFHEGNQLPTCLENHQRRFSSSPKVILADQIYATQNNRKYLQDRGIPHSFRKLGRPPNEPTSVKNKAKTLFRKKQGQRNAIEATFGHLKERFKLKNIVLKVPDGHKIQIRLGLVAWNLSKAYQAA